MLEPLSIGSYGLYFSPTFCRGLYFRSVHGLYKFPSGLYTVCIFSPRFVVVGADGLYTVCLQTPTVRIQSVGSAYFVSKHTRAISG